MRSNFSTSAIILKARLVEVVFFPFPLSRSPNVFQLLRFYKNSSINLCTKGTFFMVNFVGQFSKVNNCSGLGFTLYWGVVLLETTMIFAKPQWAMEFLSGEFLAISIVRVRRCISQSPMALTPLMIMRSQFVSKQEKFFSRCTPRNSGPQSRDSPPKRDTGIANEKDWGISLLNENVNESGTNEYGSTWFRESGEDLGDNGYICRWTRMGGQSHDGTSNGKKRLDVLSR